MNHTGGSHRFLTILFLLLCSVTAIPGTAPAGILQENERKFPNSYPPPPAEGSPAQREDLRIFTSTRALEGSERWFLARSDARRGTGHLLSRFSCAAGLELSARKYPHVAALLAHSVSVVNLHNSDLKNRWKRLRPVSVSDLPICTDNRWLLKKTYSYPSGHTSRGWIAAYILADLMPERAENILERGRIYGESRFVCGAHWKSDVDEAHVISTNVFSVIRNTPWFKEEEAQARTELSAMKADNKAPDPATCAAERRAAEMTF